MQLSGISLFPVGSQLTEFLIGMLEKSL